MVHMEFVPGNSVPFASPHASEDVVVLEPQPVLVQGVSAMLGVGNGSRTTSPERLRCRGA